MELPLTSTGILYAGHWGVYVMFFQEMWSDKQNYLAEVSTEFKHFFCLVLSQRFLAFIPRW